MCLYLLLGGNSDEKSGGKKNLAAAFFHRKLDSKTLKVTNYFAMYAPIV